MKIVIEIVTWLWQLLNTPAGITFTAGLLLYLLNRLYAAKPLWQQYEGTIVSAIRTAEKLIPNDTENRSMARFDQAMQFVLEVFEERNKREPTAAEKTILEEGINLKHNELSVEGALTAPAPTPPVVES